MPETQAAIAARLISCLDFTELGDACTADDVAAFLKRVETPAGFVAAVCVWPRFVAQCRGALAGTPVRIATVVNFPHGSERYEAALADTRQAVADGADEIDMVIARAHIPADPAFVTDQVAAFVEAAGGSKVKAIVETGEMASLDEVRSAARAAIAGGAGFIKTSTGKVPVNATLEAAEIMLTAIEEGRRDHGRNVGFKPAGGIKTAEDAAAYLALADKIMGHNWVSASTFRFGASGLLDALIAELDGKTVHAGEGY